MVRPRTALLASFPEGSLTPEEASNALRRHGGDLEGAKRDIEGKLNKDDGEAASATLPQNAAVRVNNKDSNVPPLPQLPPTTTQLQQPLPERLPPRAVSSINNLSDRQYCCVWSVEVLEDGYRPDMARALLARVARHVNPILRERGWRVKRLMESAATSWIGLCTGNGRDDADAASTNIQLNLRVLPNRQCRAFRSFAQVLSVMLHEITHTSIGLEDIHPPTFFELLDDIRGQYFEKLQAGEVDKETDDYGCSKLTVTVGGSVKTIGQAVASQAEMSGGTELGKLAEEGECGVKKKKRRRWGRGYKRPIGKGYQSNVPKRRPLLRGTKMIDGRTKAGKLAKIQRDKLTPQELAARAALARFGQKVTENEQEHDEDSGSDDDSSTSDEENVIVPHTVQCACRSCDWEKLFLPPSKEIS
jgi:hypothetical protein